MLADAVSYLLSAAGIRAIGGREPQPSRPGARRPRAGDLLDGWRYILAHPALRPLFFNVLLVSGLIMATEPLIAILMLGRLGFRPWQYGLAFAAPCVGGVLGSRLARHLAGRFGRHPVLFAARILRTCWLLGLAFVRPGAAGLVLVIAVQFGPVTCCGVFNPMLAAHRLGQTTPERVVRTLAAWSVSSSLTIAALTALWGALVTVIGPRSAIGVAGVLILGTPLLLPRRDRPAQAAPSPGALTPEPVSAPPLS